MDESAVLTWLAGVGHGPMLEDPEGWSGAMLDFLAAGDRDEVTGESP